MSDLPRGLDTPAAAPPKGLLRFLTCGSVDDGKSTLIGRLLHDTQTLFDDHLSTLKRDSARHGTVPGGIDFALLLDGLEAEREQGITIDVAYRFFNTDKRAFIVADTPGHEQYTRNMATGASTAELAVVLVDATKGLLPQTRRHSFIASLLGIRQIVLAVNKIDLVGHDEETFRRIEDAYRDLAGPLGFETVTAIPVSARHGDNVVERGTAMAWYRGSTLLEALEAADTRLADPAAPFRLPVQWVNRPNADFRGYCGTIASGRLALGETVRVAASDATSRVQRILASGREVECAGAGDAVTLVLEDEIDVSRGDLLSTGQETPEQCDQFAAHLIWMSPEPLVPGRSYLLRIGSRTLLGSVTEIKHVVDVERFQHLAAKSLKLNEIALVNISLREPAAFDAYRDNRQTGAFIVIDRASNQTVGAGVIEFALRRATNIRWQPTDVTKRVRAEALGQKPVALWFTGLSGAGKSTIANLLEQRLFALGRHTYLLDGDNVRHGLNRDLGFTEADRVENIRRVAQTARLFVDAGLITLVSLISPYRSERAMARELFEPGEFVEIFVDTPIEIAERRDPKGLYVKARQGLIKNFTGIDSPYEVPESPELHLRTKDAEPDALVEDIIERLQALGVVPDID